MDIPERVYFQYRSKPKAVKWFAINQTIGDELIEAFGEIRDSYDIDTATGAQLDIIGAIVGVGRDITRGQVLDVTQFALEANADDAQFGDTMAQFSEGVVSDDNDLDDAYLRQMIRWKISANNSHVTIENTLAALRIVMPDKVVIVNDPEDMTFSLEFIGDGPDSIDASILSLQGVVPRPQGVQYTGYSALGVFQNVN